MWVAPVSATPTLTVSVGSSASYDVSGANSVLALRYSAVDPLTDGINSSDVNVRICYKQTNPPAVNCLT